MDIFAKENVGRNIRCRVEKGGETGVTYVRWTHAKVGEKVKRSVSTLKNGNSLVNEVTDGWAVVEVGV